MLAGAKDVKIARWKPEGKAPVTKRRGAQIPHSRQTEFPPVLTGTAGPRKTLDERRVEAKETNQT